jgi:hypothetical protein
MKFLQLTDSADGLSIWVNTDLVTTMKWDGDTKTTDMYFVDSTCATVSERPQEILKLLNPLVQ